MNTLIHWSATALKVFLVGFLAMVLVAVGMWFAVVKPDAASQVDPRKDRDRELVLGEAGEDHQQFDRAGADYLVPDHRIPASQQARYEAAPITLFADRREKAAAELPGPQDDVATLTRAERRALTRDVRRFLAAWETFSPPVLRAREQTEPARYARKLAPMVDAGALREVANRVDSTAPARISPSREGTVGSTFHSADTWNATNVRYFDGREAYVTTYGAVRYRAVIGPDNLDGVLFHRSYALLLRKSAGRWLVTRAAAYSLGVLR